MWVTKESSKCCHPELWQTNSSKKNKNFSNNTYLTFIINESSLFDNNFKIIRIPI